MRGLGFEIGNAAHEEIGVCNFTLTLMELKFLFQLVLLEGKPFTDLLAAEGGLMGIVANVEDGRWMFGLDFMSDTKGTMARGR